MAIDFYKLLPAMTRWFDHSASADTAGETNASKVLYSWEQEWLATQEDVEGLAEIIDPDVCEPEYLYYLSSLIGSAVGPGSSDIEFKRWFVKNLCYFYKKKGTHLLFDKQFQWILGKVYKLHELWKTIPHEHGDYFRSPNYYADIKAARFDVYSEQDGNRTYLDPSDARPIASVVSHQLPIHVILRHWYQLVYMTDEMAIIEEDVSGSIIELSFIDDLDDFKETYVILSEVCQGSCEAACQSEWELITCTFGCESSCEYFACETTCQDSCQMVCQVASCQFGGCEVAGCEGTSCQAGGCEEPPCALSCQAMEESNAAGGQLACLSVAEVELFPAQIVCIGDDPNDPAQADFVGQILGFVHWPQHNYPPVDESWRITLGVEYPVCGGCEAGCETICELTDTCPPESSENLEYSLTGHTDLLLGAGIGLIAGIHQPQFYVGQWVLVRCVKGGIIEEVVTDDADGTSKIFCGTLKHQPHPGTVKIKAEGVPKATGRAIIRAGDCQLYNPKVDNIEVGLTPGESVQLWNVRGETIVPGFYDIGAVSSDELDLTTCLCLCETGCEGVGETGGLDSCEMGCETGYEPAADFVSYRAGVIPGLYNQIGLNTINDPGGSGDPCESGCECGCTLGCEAFCETGDEGACATGCEDGSQFPSDPWSGIFEGDVDSGSVNYRSPYAFMVEFKSAPMRGSAVVIEYVRETDCTYILDQVIDITAGLAKRARITHVDFGGCFAAGCEISCETNCQGTCETSEEGILRCQLLNDEGNPITVSILVNTNRRPSNVKLRNAFPLLAQSDDIDVYFDNEENWWCPNWFQGILVDPPP